MADEKVQQFEGGTKREKLMPQYRLIPIEALDALTRRYELGSKKYGEDNWRKSISNSAFLDDCYNHLVAHALHYNEVRSGRAVDDDDDLAAIMWGAATLIVAREHARRQRAFSTGLGGSPLQGLGGQTK